MLAARLARPEGRRFRSDSILPITALLMIIFVPLGAPASPPVEHDGRAFDGLYPSPERTAILLRWLAEKEPSSIAEHLTSVPLPSDRNVTRRDPPLTWTFLFYDDADFPNAYDPFVDFRADAHSDVNVNVLVLRDTNSGPATLLRITETHNHQFLEAWGEVDMGAAETLRDFIAYGKTNYPADRYLVALYDHGGGWSGCCWDVTNDGFLRMDDMQQALVATGGIDIVAFTAPCLMAAVEAAYELRSCVDVYVGSEELSGFAFWHGIMGPICDMLNDSALLSNEDIATQMLELVAANTYYPDPWMTMSAVKAADVAPVAPLVDAFSQHALAHMADLYTDLSAVRLATWEMGMGGLYDVDEVDLQDLADQWAGTDPLATELLHDIREAVDTAVIHEVHGASQLRTHGLSISWPESLGTYNDYYVQVDLDWVADTGWDEFLMKWMTFDEDLSPVAGPQPDLAMRGGPNPAAGSAQVRFALPERCPVQLTVFDVAGRRIRTLLAEQREAGPHSICWDGCDARGRPQPSGTYLFVLEAAGQCDVRKITLVR